MAEKCKVIEGRIVEPCADLNRQCEVGNPPPGKSRGLYEWRYHNTETHKVSRAFFGVKTTANPKGMAFNFCPWCGERIDQPFNPEAHVSGVMASQAPSWWQVSYDHGKTWHDRATWPDPNKEIGLAMARVKHVSGVTPCDGGQP